MSLKHIQKLTQSFYSKAAEEYKALTCDVSLTALEDWNPFRHAVWIRLKTPITKTEVQEAIEKKDFVSEPILEEDHYLKTTRKDHIGRVAYFVIYGWSDPIEIDVGVPELGVNVSWIIIEGNHRLASAFYKNDQTIKANISGSLNYAEELLGIKIE